MSKFRNHRRLRIASAVALAVGILMRMVNVLEYRLLFGFDALHNWIYISYLKKTWELPPPDAMWSSAHPPLFYYMSAAICRALDSVSNGPQQILLLRGVGSVFGLVAVAMAFLLVRRLDPENPRRAALAGGLVLFLPVHIYMSAMLSEEVLVASLMSLVIVGVCLELAEPEYKSWLWVAMIGLFAGLAFLTKLTGVLAMVAAVGAYLVDGVRRGRSGPALQRAGVIVLLTVVVGGWYYARNFVEYGYLYPQHLDKHKIMFTMPPGERQIGDYLGVPLATWTDPQVLNPDLLRSIWGSTYLTMWFDGHRFFLPTDTPAVTRVGTAILLLALLPMAAFGVGVVRGARRAVRERDGADTAMLLLIGVTLFGYVLFTWRNPWFPVHKASFMLCLSVPFAYYASAALDRWWRHGGLTRIAMGAAGATLLVLIVGTFTITRLFWSWDHMLKPGVVW